ncbi:MAG: hypothetical protein HQ475_00855 [SAR202 cluster bacterium]|nr:hypothetical protein [SAR202 cluster bacterium]
MSNKKAETKPAVSYDVVLAGGSQFFASRLRELCGQLDLSFFLVEPLWINEFLAKLRQGDLKVEVLIEMAAELYDPNDPYLQMAKEVKRQGGHVIDDPDVGAVMAHKGRFHQILVENQVPVPETIIVQRKELKGFRLTDEITDRVGVPFVVKPGWGGGGQGVIVNAQTKEDLLRSAEMAPNSDSFMIQRRLTPKQLEGHLAWFRVFHVLGEIIPCWWEPGSGVYQLLSPLQRRLYHLRPVTTITRDIARISRMHLFSTEVCLTEDGKFFAVDYLNTDPDMNPKSFYRSGVPDEVVRRIAWQLVDHAMHVARRRHGSFDDELDEKDLDWGDRRRRGLLIAGE